MMNNNKILTVSYGTFSCTLEGFDDSFGTMKAIAEYFRDLAADDRYFGAEPPQPDAEMLARIAQKEVSRRVEAREQDGQIVLSALPGQAVAESAPVAAPPEAPVDLAQEPPAEEVSAPDITLEEEPVDLPAEDLSLEEVAVEEVALDPEEETADVSTEDAVLATLADTVAVAEVQEAVAEDTVEVAADDTAEVEAQETPEDITAQDDAPQDDTQDIVPGQPDAEVEAFFDSAPEAAEAGTPETSKAEAPAAPDANSIAAKLERIRAVVTRQTAPEASGFLEDEHADDTALPDPISEARADIEEALKADDEAEAIEAATTEDDALSALLTRVNASDPAPEATQEAAPEEEESDALGNLFSEAAEEAKAPQARVIKVKRADLEAAIEEGNLEEVAEEEIRDQPTGLDALAPSKQAETSLTAEEEAALTRELTELSADIEAEATDQAPEEQAQEPAEDAAEAAAAQAQKRPGRDVLPSLDEEDDGDVHRLLNETDHQMDEPESANRRDAFAHLRAAVQARKADASMAEEGSGDGAGAYREDLAEVVRPRRPSAGEGRTERPEGKRPAPLKLVAEQRIDVEAAAVKAPVRPRRIAEVKEVAADPDAASFADYASEMGAQSLPELLEAAAAYLSFVEGRDQFSRPQLMTKVRQVGGGESFSREDGLRHFGQLLRKGKIEKIKGGRFTVSDDIGYRPDERAAG